jgi:diaminopimelate decarboxylase
MMEKQVVPAHADHGFPVIDGSLGVGGVALPRLAARVGGTPFFAYDRRLITERVRDLRDRLPGAVHLSYAVKANPMPAVLQHLAGLVDGFDLASGGELKTALDTMMPAERISFAGPGKTGAELRQAVAAGITLNLESETELDSVAALGRELGIRPRVAVRVNPDFEHRASGMRMSGGAKQFGIDSERVPQVLGRIGEAGLDFQGFQIFTGSQNLNAETIRESQAKTIDLALELAAHAPAPLRLLNIGGGFGIPYFPGDAPLDLTAVGEGLAALLPKVEARLPGARVVVELGRYIVGEAGVYVSRIIDRKESRGQVFLIADGGLHHHLAASGNFGQVLRRNYPVAIGNRMGQAESETASVVGCLCTPLDLLADKVVLPRAEVGDLVVVFQSGAYGLTASPTAFLGHPVPAEVLV